MPEINLNRLDQAFARLQAYPRRNAVLDDRFRETILSANDDTLNRINSHTLSAKWNTDTSSVLTWLLYASQVGLFDLHWESHCPHCTGLTGTQGRLGQIEHESQCGMCQVGFGVHADYNVEVTFTVNPSIRPTQPSPLVFLPGNTRLLGLYQTAEPLRLTFDEPGQYFLIDLQAGMPGAIARFDVAPDNPPMSDIKLTFYRELADPMLTTLKPGVLTATVNGTSMVACAYRNLDKKMPRLPVVTGLDVMLTPDFKALFSHDTLSQRESLSVRSLTVMFTDITGSTALYQRLGDVRAYNLVRDHFDVLFKEIEDQQGVVVKTIGDAVMAAFPNPELALKAALDVQHSIRQFNRPRTPEQGVVLVKIGLHMGSAIAVNLNNMLDYFGNMVNTAARIQSQSRSEEVLISEDVYSDPGVRQILAGNPDLPDLMISDSMFELHGIGEKRLYSILSK